MGMGNAPRVLDSKGVCEMGGEALEVDALGKGITNNAGATTQAMGDSSKLLRSVIALVGGKNGKGSSSFGIGNACLASKDLVNADQASQLLGDFVSTAKTSGGAIPAVNTLGDATISAKTSRWTQGRDASDGGLRERRPYQLGGSADSRHRSGRRVCGLGCSGDFDGNLRLGGSLCGSLGIGRVDPCMGETDLGTKTPLREVDVPSCGGDRGAQANRGNTVDVR
ncbi:unnamed protein product [Ilex paraguariensis]|uniref:Uncharacterized protein n=1 Tax=Ilex paraguariensis TaxID=185542 RepID=A0ABC8T9D0_9AQUA